MKKILILIWALVLSLTISIPAFADTDIESAGNIFMFENSINREFKSEGDVYAFGNSIDLNGATEGDILAFGNTININAKDVKGSIRSAGASVSILASSVRNITAAGGVVSVLEGTTAKGVYIAGGTIDFLGNAEDLFITGDVVTINGVVTGNVKVECSQLTIGENAKIDGTIEVRGENEPTILGNLDPSKVDFQQVANTTNRSFQSRFNIMGIIIKLISSILIAVILVVIFRRNLERSTVGLIKKPWLPFVIGFCTLIVLPIAAILVMITVVGIPIGVIFSIIYGIVIYLSTVITAIVLGRIILKNINIYLSSIAAVVALRILLLIPYLGGVLRFLCVLLALGVFVLEIVDKMVTSSKTDIVSDY